VVSTLLPSKHASHHRLRPKKGERPPATRIAHVPLYEYRCRSCGVVFDERRPASESTWDATCPDGHEDAVRLLSVFASTGGRSEPAAATGGGCCGGACGCGH
jgi:putative FmdB family regulatory protein